MSRPTILLVDDAPDALDVWELVLRASGFDVRTAGDGPSALASVARARPDAVVMDLELPGVSGLDVARVLRKQYGPALPLIAVTGHAGGRLAAARTAGFDATFVKPCLPDGLVAEIRRRLAAAE